MIDSSDPAAPTERSYASLTVDHLARLAILAERDHLHFCRPGGRSEYARRRLAIVLAQGAAQHYVDCANAATRLTGVTDLDIWTFYASIDDVPFPAYRRITSTDFGPSALGTQSYDLSLARNAKERGDWRKFSRYSGRRADFMVRDLHVDLSATSSQTVTAIQDWLQEGQDSPPARRKSNWHLASRPVVIVEPADRRGEMIWPLPKITW